jgi:nicotinamidase/pyrazinamidase
MKRNNVLMIIDPQYDFISGSLACKDAIGKMTNLANHIRDNADEYDSIVITVDWHPINHCSFIENGGGWPKHCVQYSYGASVYQDILNNIPKDKNVYFLTKGSMPHSEEYSIMKNLVSSSLLTSFILNKENTTIDICGIAGDVCVLNTVKDLTENGFKDKITVLKDFVACVTSNEPLLDFAKENNITVK